MFEKYSELEEWIGTPTELYGEIESIARTDKWKLNINTDDKRWPKAANALSRYLNELIPTLEEKNLKIDHFEDPDKQRTRKIKIRKIPSEPSEPSEHSNSCSKSDNSSDDTSDDVEKISSIIPSENNTQIRAQNQVSDDMDDMDDTLHTSMGDVSSFIKLEGYQRGDKITYFVDSVVADLSVQNNFIGGNLRMRGEGDGAYPTNFLKFIDETFGPEENTIEVCSRTVKGLNQGGSCFTVDINPEFKPDLVADGQDLAEIPANKFSRYRCDPPYNAKTAKEMYNTELPSEYKLLLEGARVVKPGSLLFLLHEHSTNSNIPGLQKIGFIHVTALPNRTARILNIYVKLSQEAS